MPRPALMLPAGEKEWEKRLAFMELLKGKLDSLGWTIGLELKCLFLDEWAKECHQSVVELGGRITWHPPTDILYGLGSEDNSAVMKKLEDIAYQAEDFHNHFGLEAVVLHAAPAVVRVQKPSSDYSRYFSPIEPEEMLAHLQRQVEPLKMANEISGGILHLENLDICLYGEYDYTLPTYLALPAGAWLDLSWLAEQTGCKTVFDSEHYFSSKNFLYRLQEFEGMFDSLVGSSPTEKFSQELQEIAGYCVVKNRVPWLVKGGTIVNYINLIKPNLYHVGGAISAFNRNDEVEGHLPFASVGAIDGSARTAIREALWRLMKEGSIGALVECCGQNALGMYSPWSARINDDEVAKMQTYLALIDEIENLQNE